MNNEIDWIENYYPINSHISLSNQYHLFTDRIHAGGLLKNEFEFILRRSSHYADIVDYPEPSTSTWDKEKQVVLHHELSISSTKNNRRLKEAKHLFSQYHRFFWMLNNNCEPDKQNIRLDDDITLSLDHQRVWIVKDLDKKQETRLERKE